MADAIEYLLRAHESPVLVSSIPNLEPSEQLELAESLYDLGLFEAIPDNADDK